MELKPVVMMSFGDWELFRRYIDAMREREFNEQFIQESDNGTQFTQMVPGKL